VVVASGRTAATGLFPRDPDRSPYSTPQRILTAGLFHGIAPTDPGWIHFQVTEAGEIFSTRILTADGPVHGMVVEALPGGPLEQLASYDHAADPAGFEKTLLGLVADHAPELRERITDGEFAIRQGWTILPSGRVALALGDAWVVNDPLTGQGANLGSACAFELAQLIVAGGPFDAGFAGRAAEALWRIAEPVVAWSNLNIGPPPEHLGQIFAAAPASPTPSSPTSTTRRRCGRPSSRPRPPGPGWRWSRRPADRRAPQLADTAPTRGAEGVFHTVIAMSTRPCSWARSAPSRAWRDRPLRKVV
jgi:hypothetical protein